MSFQDEKYCDNAYKKMFGTVSLEILKPKREQFYKKLEDKRIQEQLQNKKLK